MNKYKYKQRVVNKLESLLMRCPRTTELANFLVEVSLNDEITIMAAMTTKMIAMTSTVIKIVTRIMCVDAGTL